MIKTTQKEIQETNAIDITYYTKAQIEEIKQKECFFNEIAYAPGLYGVNAILYQGHNTKELYKITSRTNARYYI